MRRALIALALFLGLAAAATAPRPAHAQALVADLSKHLVAITTGFAGTDVLLFGSIDAPGEVVVVVRGPERETLVRKKARSFGVWYNAYKVQFDNAPAYYWMASSAPLEEITTASLRARHQLGPENIEMRVAEGQGLEPELVQTFRDGLVERKRAKGHYSSDIKPVTFLGDQLFRSEMHFPSDVPVGTYQVEVYLLRDNQVVSAEITPLVVSKVGIGADVFNFAYDHAAWYGVIAIIVAVFSGWLASVAFRKG